MMGFRDRQASVAAIERKLTRLADGTLAPAQRKRLERLVAGSPELKRRLREQRRAVLVARAIAEREQAPLTLRMAHRVVVAPRLRPRWLTDRRPVVGLGMAGAVVAAAITLGALGGGQPGLTVAQAATISLRPALARVTQPPDESVTLPRLRGAGLPFPYWEDRFGWRATGVRRDRIAGRVLTTVFYRRDRAVIAYTIVAGPPLPAGVSARAIVRAGTTVETLSTGEESAVTWLRRGHTCVLSGAGVPLNRLLDLAIWRGGGELPY